MASCGLATLIEEERGRRTHKSASEICKANQPSGRYYHAAIAAYLLQECKQYDDLYGRKIWTFARPSGFQAGALAWIVRRTWAKAQRDITCQRANRTFDASNKQAEPRNVMIVRRDIRLSTQHMRRSWAIQGRELLHQHGVPCYGYEIIRLCLLFFSLFWFYMYD